MKVIIVANIAALIAGFTLDDVILGGFGLCGLLFCASDLIARHVSTTQGCTV